MISLTSGSLNLKYEGCKYFVEYKVLSAERFLKVGEHLGVIGEIIHTQFLSNWNNRFPFFSLIEADMSRSLLIYLLEQESVNYYFYPSIKIAGIFVHKYRITATKVIVRNFFPGSYFL